MFKPISFSLAKKSNLTTPIFPKSKFTTILLTTKATSSPSENETLDDADQDDKFDWFDHWYAVMPVCDLDKRVPVGKKVIGLDIVVWWDKKESAWNVFDDRCPHRLAPLSEGRIDRSGRLQCVYHGWCFAGSGDCEFIPQAPPDGPKVHSSAKACVAVYPSTVQNGIVWFWPNTDVEYKDILSRKKPPYIPQLDDPSFTFHMSNRDIPYGYEVLMENLMDPSHVPYAHHGIMRIDPLPRVMIDREGGSPVHIRVDQINKNGFTSFEQPNSSWKFVPPCLLQAVRTESKSGETSPRKDLLIFICIPVSPGNSRLISTFPRNFGFWMDPFFSRWMYHNMQNLVIDSDLYLIR